MAEPTPEDIRSVWQNQTKEATNVSLELIRLKAKQLEEKMRNELMMGYAAALVVFLVGLYMAWQGHDVFSQIGGGVLALWAPYLAYFYRKGLWRAPSTPDAPPLEFYRSALRRRHVGVGASAKLLWPAFLSFALFLTPGVMAVIRNPKIWAKTVASVALMVIWLVAAVITLKRKRQATQREIEELDLLQKL